MTALKKVLVVDDDPVVGKSFDRVLAPKGYAVIHAAGGAEALERLAADSYDMVYTDIRMPGMDGIEVARRIKASRPWMPVVIVTGYGTEANEAEARSAGVAGFLHKPLSPEAIESSALLATAPAAGKAAGAGSWLKNVALSLAGPFIGLAFIVVLPFFGIALAGWSLYKAAVGESPRRGA